MKGSGWKRKYWRNAGKNKDLWGSPVVAERKRLEKKNELNKAIKNKVKIK